MPGGKHVLDNTAIHPESYAVAKEILQANQLSEKDLGTKEAIEKLSQLSPQRLVQQVPVGEETLKDILEAVDPTRTRHAR